MFQLLFKQKMHLYKRHRAIAAILPVLVLEKPVTRTDLGRYVRVVSDRGRQPNRIAQTCLRMRSKQRQQKSADCSGTNLSTEMSQNRTLRFLLFGKIRFDDDSVGNNTIPGMEFFDSDVTFDAVTSTCTLWRGTRRGTTIEVIDCLELFGEERTEAEVTTDVVEAVACIQPGPLTFVYVVMVSDLYTEEQRLVYERLKVLLGPDVTDYTIILLLTRGDERDRKRSSLQDVLSTAPDHVHKVLEECGHRYGVFDNAADDRQSQVQDLIDAVHKLSEKHGGKPFSCLKNSKIGERIESEVARRKQQELEEKSKQVQKELVERERTEQVRMEKERDEQTRKGKDRITQLEATMETLKQQKLDAERMHEKEMKCRLKVEEEKIEKIKEMERKTKEEMLTLEKKQRDMERQRKEETAALEKKNQELQQMHERRLEMERKRLQEAERQKCEKMEKELARRLQEVDVEEAKRKKYVQEVEEKMKKAQEKMEKQKMEFDRREKERDETMKRKEMERSKQLKMETLKLQRLTDERIHQGEVAFQREVSKKEMERSKQLKMETLKLQRLTDEHSHQGVVAFEREVSKKVRKETKRQSSTEMVASGESLRFLLVGRCGNGISSTGNTILGMKLFDISRGMEFCTETCCLKRGTRSGINIEVMDTPGLLQYSRKQNNVGTEIIQGVARMQPGPTAVLYMVPLNLRYSKKEDDVYERLKALLGPRVTDHMIVVFTHGDELKWSKQTIQEVLSTASPNLRKVLDECGHRYVVFDNKADDKQSQVDDLLEKVSQLRKKNGGVPYTLPKEVVSSMDRSRKGYAYR